jgi:hypothetical protein
MILHNRRKKAFGLVALTVLILFSSFVAEHQRAHDLSTDSLRAEIMATDPGFSTGGNLYHEGEKNLTGLATKLYRIVKGYFFGFPERPTLQRLDIDIGFMEYQKLMQERKKAMTAGILVNPTKVKAKLRFQNQVYKAKLRLKGDIGGHWITKKRMSFRVNVQGNQSILGFRKFSLHKPIERQHPFDATFQSIVRRAGNLSAQHNYLRVFVNGESWGRMNIEEHMTDALLEKQQVKNSLIIRFSDEKEWALRRKNAKVAKACRLSDSRLNIHLYDANNYLDHTKYRKQLTYIAQERLKPKHVYLYDIDHYTRALLLASSWNFFHTLAHSNWRHYFNPYTLKLEPITTDQGPFLPVAVDKKGKWQPLKNSPFKLMLYQQILHTDTFQSRFPENLNAVNDALAHLDEDMLYYHSFFPIDRHEHTEIVHNNMKIINTYREQYFLQHKKKIFGSASSDTQEEKQPLSKKEASFLPEHIYARHYDDGTIEIYNLLHEPVILKKILLGKKNFLEHSIIIPGYSDYKPYIIQSGITGTHDNAIEFETEFKGNIRKVTSEITFSSNNIFNPLLTKQKNDLPFLRKIGKNAWEISSGEWNINEPLTINGSLTILPNAHLRFAQNAYLIVKGHLQADGEGGPITLEPQAQSWQGIYVLPADTTTSSKNNTGSFLNNIKIKNTAALEDGILQLAGGVTFYSSNVHMENVFFDGSYAEHALHIVKSEFSLLDITFRSAKFNGFAADFSSGSVQTSFFQNMGKDGAVFSGTDAKISMTRFREIGRNALAVGETGKVYAEQCAVENADIGLAVKDGAQVTLVYSVLDKCRLSAAVTYRQKSFFDIPGLVINSSRLDKEKNTPILRQPGTFMTVDGQEMAETKFDIKKLYTTGNITK